MSLLPKIDINLHPMQGEVFTSEASEILYGGAAGGGKSYLMRAAAVIWASQIPGLQIYLFRRNFPDLEANHLNGPAALPILLGPLIDNGFVKWNKTKYTFEFWNGSVIKLCHCQRDDDRFKYLGAEIHVLLIDELSQFTSVVYKFLRTRVRMVGVKVPKSVQGHFPKILCGSNPGGPAHQFMKQTWIDPAPPMAYHRADDDEGGMLRQFIPAKIADNPSLLDEDPDYPNRIRGMGDEKLVEAYLDGNFDVVIGGIFDDIWDQDIHVIKPFRIPSSWYVDRAFDWGSSKPFSIGWFAESDGTAAVMADGSTRHFPAGTVFQIGEWYGWNGKSDEGIKMEAVDIAKGINDMEQQIPYRVYGGPADASIFDDQNGNCIADDMQDEGVVWTVSDKRPGSRVLGVEKLRTLLKEATRVRMEKPGLFIFENCRHTIRTLPTCPRDTIRFDDVARGYEDHVIDMLRYRVRGEKQAVGQGVNNRY